jgi:ATP-binding cassette subfamily G (WHITE) protein 2 (PDR)
LKKKTPLTVPDLISAIASTGLAGRPVQCSSKELAIMQPPPGLDCGTYLSAYEQLSGGKVYNPTSKIDCQFCTARNADQFLRSVAIKYSTRWRDYGIGFAYILFNIFSAVGLYYLFRVRKGSGKSLKERLSPVFGLFKKHTEEKPKEAGSESGNVVEESKV